MGLLSATASVSAGATLTGIRPAPERVIPPAAPTSAAPGTVGSFDAIARRGANWPADPTGALGASVVVTAVDASYAVYDRTGRPLIGPSELASLLARTPPRAAIADPRVVFDGYAGRFVLAYLVTDEAGTRSWVYVVSIPDETASDPSTWCGTVVAADRTLGDGRQLAVDLALGFDARRVAVSMDMRDRPNRFAGATVLAFASRRLFDCSRAPRFDTFTGSETRSATGARGRSLVPATSVGQGRSLYLTSLEPGRSSSLVLWRLSGKPGAMSLRSVALEVPRLRRSPLGTQGGAALDDLDAAWRTGGLRIAGAFADLDLGAVYAAHTVREDLDPEAGGDDPESVVRWYEIDPAGALGASRIARAGAIGAPGTDAGWPSLATDAAGDLFVTYSRAGAPAGEFLSAWIAEIAPGTTEAVTTLLEPGTGRLETMPGPEPWGGTTAMSRDPLDGALVMAVNQVAVDDGTDTTVDWQQTVHLVSHVP